MVTTFSPPSTVKKKPKKALPILPVSLGIIAAALLGGLVTTNSKLTKERAASAQWVDALIKTAQAAGMETVTVESLSDATNGPAVLASVATTVGERVAALNAARAEADQLKAAVTRVESEGQAAQEQVTALRAQVDAARAEAKAKADELAALQKQSAAEVAQLKAAVTDLEARLEDAQASAAASAGASEAPAPAAEAPAAEPAPEPAPAAVEAPADPTGTEAPVAVAAPAPATTSGIEGKSLLFKSVKYDQAKSRLLFRTLDDQVIIHKEVPVATYEALMAAPIFDIYYRFSIMDNFESEPKIREYLGNKTAD